MPVTNRVPGIPMGPSGVQVPTKASSAKHNYPFAPQGQIYMRWDDGNFLGRDKAVRITTNGPSFDMMYAIGGEEFRSTSGTAGTWDGRMPTADDKRMARMSDTFERLAQGGATGQYRVNPKFVVHGSDFPNVGAGLVDEDMDGGLFEINVARPGLRSIAFVGRFEHLQYYPQPVADAVYAAFDYVQRLGKA